MLGRVGRTMPGCKGIVALRGSWRKRVRSPSGSPGPRSIVASRILELRKGTPAYRLTAKAGCCDRPVLSRILSSVDLDAWLSLSGVPIAEGSRNRQLKTSAPDRDSL